MAKFDYELAFSRNLGWVTKEEQQQLRSKRIAIAGMGGAGGEYLVTFSRLGIGNFNIADLDTFEVGNFNRQAGATMETVDTEKVKAMEEQALLINPELNLNIFTNGVTEDNLSEFMKDVDLYVDAIDVFTIEIRIKIFEYCSRHGIPAITAAPMGMGVGMLCFMPGKMTFEEYFRMSGKSEVEQQVRFVIGVSPARFHLSYVADHDEIDFVNHKVPSTIMGIKLCAGAVGATALKILLRRGKVLAAPRGIHFDAYQNKFKRTWVPWGNNNPLQKFAIAYAKRKFNIKT